MNMPRFTAEASLYRTEKYDTSILSALAKRRLK